MDVDDEGNVMSYTPCRYAQRWPELWERLSSDAERRNISNVLASGRLEGMEPDRELVVDLVAQSRGEITGEEFRARALARVLGEPRTPSSVG